MSNVVKAFYYLNTNVLKLKNVRSNKVGGGILNAASGTAEVLDKAFASIANGGPYAIAYTPNSQGEYTVSFPSTITVPVGKFVNIEVLVNGGVGLTYRGVIEARVVQ